MSSERERKNLLKNFERRLIEQLCERMPDWVTPDLLTATGFAGSLVIFLGLWLATFAKIALLISVIGLAIQWFGDSLDGRLAYYRNRPRKWYGWALDLNTDWVSACVIGLGFYYYLPPEHRIVSFVFVVAYGGSMIVSLLRYRITDKYTIDTFFLGPTELRVLIAFVLLIEIFRANTLLQFGLVGSLLLIIFNLLETYKVLKMGDQRDQQEKAAKTSESASGKNQRKRQRAALVSLLSLTRKGNFPEEGLADRRFSRNRKELRQPPICTAVVRVNEPKCYETNRRRGCFSRHAQGHLPKRC